MPRRSWLFAFLQVLITHITDAYDILRAACTIDPHGPFDNVCSEHSCFPPILTPGQSFSENPSVLQIEQYFQQAIPGDALRDTVIRILIHGDLGFFDSLKDARLDPKVKSFITNIIAQQSMTQSIASDFDSDDFDDEIRRGEGNLWL
jgi:hypothetical protein